MPRTELSSGGGQNNGAGDATVIRIDVSDVLVSWPTVNNTYIQTGALGQFATKLQQEHCITPLLEILAFPEEKYGPYNPYLAAYREDTSTDWLRATSSRPVSASLYRRKF